MPIFADDYPVNLQTLASFKELNRQLKQRNIPMTVTERRFRPNILVSGDLTYGQANLILWKTGSQLGHPKEPKELGMHSYFLHYLFVVLGY